MNYGYGGFQLVLRVRVTEFGQGLSHGMLVGFGLGDADKVCKFNPPTEKTLFGVRGLRRTRRPNQRLG